MLLNLRRAGLWRAASAGASRTRCAAAHPGRWQAPGIGAGGGRNRRRPGDFTMPMHREDGSVLGAVGGALKLQSQSLLPPSMALPERDDSRLVVFSRDGTILSHSNPARVLGNVRDEAGLSAVYAQWLQQAQPLVGRGITQVMPDHIVSMAGMPLPSGWLPGSVTRALCWRHWRVRNAMHGGPWQVHWAQAPCCWCCCWGGWPNPWLGCGWLHSNCCRATPRGPCSGPGCGVKWVTWSRRWSGWRARAASMRSDSPRWAASFRRSWTTPRSVIVITRHGVLEVVGRQTCLMLGYTLPNCKASPRAPSTPLRGSARWLRQGAGRVCGARRV